MREKPTKVVLDTNILVAAGFNPDSHSSRLIKLIRQGKINLIWQTSTRAESRQVINQIPALDWPDIE